MMENDQTGYEMSDEDFRTAISSSTGPRPKDMPRIDHLEDAVKLDGEGRPYMDLMPGQRVVIERHVAMFPGSPWLDTKVYYINDVDQSTGAMKLFYEELHQHARDNFLEGLRGGSRYKKLPAIGRWDAPPRERRQPVAAPPPAPTGPVTPGEKRGRGRPKGVKNRPKEVIEAEREALRAARAARRAAR